MRDLLSVEVRGDLIIVAWPGTAFTATYQRQIGQPSLVLLASTTDSQADRQTIYQFRADAFAAAINKARELGWIV